MQNSHNLDLTLAPGPNRSRDCTAPNAGHAPQLNCDLGGQCGRDTPYTDDAYLIAPAPNGRVFSVGLAYRGNKTVSVVNAWHSAGTGSVWDADISFDAGQLSGPSDQLLVSPDGQHLFTRE